MRIQVIVLLSVLCLTQVNAFTFGQKITLKTDKGSLESILKELERQSGYTFFYKKNEVIPVKNMSVDMQNVPFEEALNIVLKKTDFNFDFFGKTVVLKKTPISTGQLKTETETLKEVQPAITIKGMVTDTDGNPLSGTSVNVKGGQLRKTTNANGEYDISVPSPEAILVFSYVGFESREIKVGNQRNINVRLSMTNQDLEQIVVLGYGQEVRKIDLTGSVSQVNMDDVGKAPVGNLDEAIQGRIAGVNISAIDGQPGEEMNIVIRGGNSITQDNSPLYVVDGFPMEEFESSSINPEDIESITVLKDASSTSIYGARGANGVILIETKQGKVGAPVITFNNMVGIQQVQKMMELMSPYEFVKYQQELNASLTNNRYLSGYGRELEDYKSVKGISWQDQIFRKSINRRHNLSVRGGNANTRYAISGSVFDQSGVILNTGYKRYSGRLTLNQKISEKIDANLNVAVTGREKYGGTVREEDGATITAGLLTRVWGYRPITGTLIEEDLLEADMDEEEVDQYDNRLNPLVTQSNLYNPRYNTDVSANGYVQYKIAPSWTLKSTGSLFTGMTRNEAFYNSKTGRGSLNSIFNTKGINASVSHGQRITWSNNTTLRFNKTYNRRHRLTGLGGLEVQSSSYKYYRFETQQIPNESLGMAGMGQGIPLGKESEWREYGLLSFFGRVDYSYRSKYILTGTLRADASSKFSKSNRWGHFPAVAAAWNMHRENWFKKQNVVTSSKLRLSYGLNGNNRIGEYVRFPTVSFSEDVAYSWGNGTPLLAAVPDLPTPNIKWETTENIDLGWELSFLKGKLDLEIDLYRKNTRDLLLNSLIPTSQGFTHAMKNVGSVRNEGLEFTLNTVNIDKKTFSWNSSFNISFNRGKILELNGAQDKMYATPRFISQYATNPLYIAEVGSPVGMFYGYIWDGTYKYEDFTSQGEGNYILSPDVTSNGDELVVPGDIKYRDLNGDLTIDNNDLTVIGRGVPIHTGGFNNNLVYKNFSLNIFLQWNYGNDIYNANRLLFDGNGNVRNNLNQFASYADRWTPENPNSDIFRTQGQGVIGWHSSRVLEDGSYLRLKTVSLDYSLPQKLIKQAYVKKLTLGVAGQNLLTWTNYSGMDPEVSTRAGNLTPGFDYIAYPLPRTVVFTLNATF
ncbi:TonB-dependent receptor [Parapedobacter sp. SGR-10]|uniref:TonB-dependent receptor n=1 Tax=Parapedobacter sp. SGR-10 TaxID=2710879 RepID=UPI0019821CF9|nr:TonB-dependent receptor [Parapedobacter sp. SGR-10]